MKQIASFWASQIAAAIERGVIGAPGKDTVEHGRYDECFVPAAVVVQPSGQVDVITQNVGAGASDARAVVNELVAEGECYTTISDDHIVDSEGDIDVASSGVVSDGADAVPATSAASEQVKAIVDAESFLRRAAELCAVQTALRRDSTVGLEGLQVDEIISKVGVGASDDRAAVNELVARGVRYTTISDDHIAAIEGDIGPSTPAALEPVKAMFDNESLLSEPERSVMKVAGAGASCRPPGLAAAQSGAPMDFETGKEVESGRKESRWHGDTDEEEWQYLSHALLSQNWAGRKLERKTVARRAARLKKRLMKVEHGFD